MPNPRNKMPTLSDGTGVNYNSLVRFLESARRDLLSENKEEPAFYFEMFEDWLKNHYQKNKSFVYESKILGL